MHALRAHVSYKTAADWLDWPYIRIPDWLFLNANEGSNRRTVEPKFLDGFKNMKAAFRQQQKLLSWIMVCDISVEQYIGVYIKDIKQHKVNMIHIIA